MADTPVPEPVVSKPSPKKGRRYRWVRRVARVFIGFVTLFAIADGVLSSVRVQQWLVPYVVGKLRTTLETRVAVRAVNIGIPDRVLLYGLELDDQRGQPLLYADAVKVGMVHFPFFRWITGTTKRPLAARSVNLVHPYINLYVSQRDSLFNAGFLFESDDTEEDTSASRPIILEFEAIEVEEMRLDFVDSTLADTLRRPVAGALNYSFVQVEHFNLSTSLNLDTDGPLRAYVSDLTLSECHAGFHVQQLRTDFQMYLGETEGTQKKPYVRFRRLELDQDSTHLSGTFTFENESFETFFESGPGKQYAFAFEPSRLHFSTLGYLTGDRNFPLAGEARIEGTLSGSPDYLAGNGLRLGIGNHTELLTTLKMQDYQSEQIFLDVDIQPSVLDFADLDRFLATVELPAELRRFGTSRLVGTYQGHIDDFMTKLQLTSDVGSLSTELALKLGSPTSPMKYQGWLRTDSLNLDIILGTPISSGLNLYAEVDAAGDTPETANGSFSFHTLPSNVSGERIDTAYGAFTIKGRVLDGTADLEDAQGSFQGKITYDFSGERPRYYLVGDLQKADLQHYGITDKPLSLTTIFNVDLRGDSLENISGGIRLFELRLDDRAKGTHEQIRDVRISSNYNTQSHKQVKLISELLDFGVQGNFTYEQAVTIAERLAKETGLFLENDNDSISTYYAAKTASEDSIVLRSQLLIKNANPLLKFLETGISVDRGTSVQLKLDLGKEDVAQLVVEAPRLGYETVVGRNLVIDLRLDKTSLENRFLCDGIIQLDTLAIGETLQLNEVLIEPRLRNKTLEYGLFTSADSGRKSLTLAGVVAFGADRIRGYIDAGESRVVINDSLWFFKQANRFEYGDELLLLKNIGIEHEHSAILLEANVRTERKDSSGTILREKADDFQMNLKNIHLSRVADLLGMPGEFSGLLNADIQIQELFGSTIPRINCTVDTFVYHQFSYGDISVKSNWSASLKKLYSNVKLLRQKEPLLVLQGYFDPNEDENPLNFVLQTKDLPLDLITPFTEGILYGVGGRINIDNITVRGKLDSPILQGRAQFDDIRFGVDYLKTAYRFSGLIRFNDFLGGTSIDFPRQVTFVDETNHTAKLGGTVYDIFGDLFLDLHFEQMDNFLIMNTKAEDNDLFYGKATVAQGYARVEGSTDKVRLTAKAVTGAGSVVSIPISFYRQDERLPYVHFRQTAGEQIMNTNVNSSPIAMDLEITATPEATLRLVFDEQAGEVIEGNGEGTISLLYDYNSDFQMFGTINIEKGAYLLNLQNVIKKNFTVQPGGTISWSGDPIEADMTINAIYKVQNAELASLDTRQSGQVDVDVFLNLQGSMLQPNISFALEIPTNNRGQGSNLTLDALLRRIQDDPGELNRQVLSLLLFRRFAPQDGFFADGGASSGVSGSVTEFISSQLNNWLGNAFDQNLDVKIDATQFQQINARVSARLLNNRLVIERNGTLVNSNQQDLTIGNITIQYRIFPGDSNRKNRENPGVLAVQIFRRENLGFGNTISSINQGVGLFFRKDFDTFGELIGRKKKTVKKADQFERKEGDTTNVRDMIRFRMPTGGTPLKDTTGTDSTRSDTTGLPRPAAYMRQLPGWPPVQGIPQYHPELQGLRPEEDEG